MPKVQEGKMKLDELNTKQIHTSDTCRMFKNNKNPARTSQKVKHEIPRSQ
jgi:hypothetical protein